MPRKVPTPPQVLASVSKIRPPARRGGRPYKTLTGAVAHGASEREVLVLLRKRLAAALDGDDLNPAAFAALLRQFRQVDDRIRALDVAEAASAAAVGDDQEDDAGGAGWDESKL